ncbi:hypothetical protein J7T55_015596 [Diaporthe amygdali]|uniref:uncharacterized protein n=1 Tax=Phomopsis amygdali TaxID=1214568 RepID=UPI0022FEFD23|nr:uncharacterized protein J7T55_015596 [Diaporthe amygdali]KAJ0120861.1 hypothetical protein J7T55_015596 [Diaporthe amygdali]
MLKFLVAFLWAFTLGEIVHIEPPLPGYSVEVLQWEVLVSLDGQTATLNGTVQQIYQQLLKINPEYAAEIGMIKKGFTSSLTDTRRSLGVSEVQDTWTVCGHFDPARASAIWEGIDYLYTIDGKPGSKPGPRMCGQVSCSYDSAIWWCNDNNTTKILPSYSDIAYSAKYIAGNCTYWSEEHLEEQVSGQQFHSDNWNTIVRSAVC